MQTFMINKKTETMLSQNMFEVTKIYKSQLFSLQLPVYHCKHY